MAPYLPQGGAGGGSSPKSTNVEVIQHGACLGLSLAALGTVDNDVFDDIKNVLHTDSAVAGEAAGISMGYKWLELQVRRLVKCLLMHTRHNMKRLSGVWHWE